MPSAARRAPARPPQRHTAAGAVGPATLARHGEPCQHEASRLPPASHRTPTSSTRGTPRGTSRYDRFSEVGNREYEESRALHIVADLVRDYPRVENVSLRGAMSEVIR